MFTARRCRQLLARPLTSSSSTSSTSSSLPRSGGPLEGLRVLDLGNFLAGPIVSFHLADMGASVIKIEKPAGDDARAVGPFAPDSGESAYFMSLNRGKRSVALDLRNGKARRILERLAADADILVENFRPGVLDKLGVGYETLKQKNPGLIYASVAGFGQHGEHASRPAFDSLLQAAGGLISVTGPPPSEGDAVRCGVSIVDSSSGLYTLVGILAALHQRSASGLGQRVDTSMLATTANLMENPIARHSIDQLSLCGDGAGAGDGAAAAPAPTGLRHPSVAPFNGFRTKDGTIYIATSNDARAHMCLEALGLGDLVTDARFATNTGRMANVEALEEAINAVLEDKTTAEWEETLVPLGVPASAINDVPTLKKRHPEVFVHVEGVSLASGPFELGAASVEYAQRSPRLGEHTREVLVDELGIVTAAELDELEGEGAVVVGSSSSASSSSSAVAS